MATQYKSEALAECVVLKALEVEIDRLRELQSVLTLADNRAMGASVFGKDWEIIEGKIATLLRVHGQFANPYQTLVIG